MLTIILAKPCCDDMDDQEAFEGDDFTFQVDCDGSPKPVAKWTKDGKGIDTKDGHFTIMQADPNAYRLIIKGMQFSFIYNIYHLKDGAHKNLSNII